jgi:three-Cys-motif partner protein
MARPPEPAEVGPWAKEKLGALGAYLDYYTKVLKNKPWRTVYVDAFAGGGTAVVRSKAQEAHIGASLFGEPADPEQLEFIRGSPSIALALENPFSTYVFVDASGTRVFELETLKAEYGDTRNIHIRPGLAEDEIRWVLERNIRRATHRGFAFLDPFGAHIGWESIRALAATGLFEVLINFPLHMAMVRLMKNDGEIPEAWRNQIDRFFGGDQWFDDVYEKASDLLGASVRKREDYMDRLLQRYTAQLKAAFGHVSAPRLIRNTRNAPLYYLLWSGPNRKGLEGANYILGMGERLARGPRGGRPMR